MFQLTDKAQSKGKIRKPVQLVSVGVLPAKGLRLKLEPDEAERLWISEEAGILSIKQLNADLLFRHWRRDGVSVAGSVRATITQQCGVTLEPVEEIVSEEIDRTFLPEGSKLAKPRFLPGRAQLCPVHFQV